MVFQMSGWAPELSRLVRERSSVRCGLCITRAVGDILVYQRTDQ
jgi:hypothetical protein